LVNNGYVENVSNSKIINNGTITNNDRFEVRAGTTLDNSGGVVDGSVALRSHAAAIIIPKP